MLVEAKTKEGILIPKGGVIIGKNSLSGFIFSPKYGKIKWKIIMIPKKEAAKLEGLKSASSLKSSSGSENRAKPH